MNFSLVKHEVLGEYQDNFICGLVRDLQVDEVADKLAHLVEDQVLVGLDILFELVFFGLKYSLDFTETLLKEVLVLRQNQTNQ